MEKFRIKMRINKLEKSFIRDRWGSLTNCFWNEMVKEDILCLEEKLKRLTQIR